MKKFKWSIMSLAIVFSICAAFATRPKFDCSNMEQYYFAGGVYSPAGTEGVNYTCAEGSEACTYYSNDLIHFFECQVGTYCTNNCFVRQNQKPAKTTKPAPNTSAQAASSH
jgi:hypothetical protein